MPFRAVGITLISTSLALGLAACSKNESTESKPSGAPAAPASSATSAPGAANGAAAPGPVVSVVTAKVEKRDITVVLQAVGSAISLASVDLRPQVTSAITQVHFKEGQFVNKGDVLFTLDTRTDETNLAKAKAQLAKDLAALADAKRQLTRSR